MGMDDTRIRGETETWKLGGGNSCNPMEMVGMSRDKADGRWQDSLSPLYEGAHRVSSLVTMQGAECYDHGLVSTSRQYTIDKYNMSPSFHLLP
jgi:hypothetical protein